MQTLLITGAAGIVGTALRPLLRQHYALRLFDRSVISELAANETAVQGDLTCTADILQAVQGVDAVLHLACAHGTDIRFETTLKPNYDATLQLLEAAERSGVKRFIFASSHHVLGQYRTDAAPVFDDLPVAPDSYYALSKVFGEACCATFAQRSAMALCVIRIGNADPQVSDARRLRLWVSARDLAQLVSIGIEHPTLHHEVFYGVSDSPQALFSNHRAKAMGYRPQDNAKDFVAARFLDYDAMCAHTSGRDFVGGAYAVSPLASCLERP
ncbi:MAG: NAD(P)-dependent oxidoreductase [Pseudomonas sp.]|uniref:NAD-dependent epimerase/dehydratase family protein n=1 Tax=Pseudomonas abieticivorans TaxID=2931382 RepID=UPI0020BD61CE|nr:NAD(P)-dependent oxidoreductase [Pseudomonas sp. PIA16]MDE1169529.1 NAD(P)-dependent oxidoreductase [Pseudomonas sp.]